MRKLATTALVGIAAVALSAGDLVAQVCNGTAPFSAGRMRVGAGIDMPDGGTIFNGELAVGSTTGLYGGGLISIFSPEGGAGSSTAFGGFLGKPMMVDAKKTVEMCPQAFIMIGENSSNSIGGGVSFGRNFKQSSFDLIPFGAALLSRDDNGVTSDFNVALLGGAGFVLNSKWTVRPYLTLPLTNNGDSVLGVMGYLNFGGGSATTTTTRR